MKEYIIWNSLKVNDNYYKHPCTDKSWISEGVTITEHYLVIPSFSGLLEECNYLGVIESDMSGEEVDSLLEKVDEYGTLRLTPVEVCSLLNTHIPNEGESLTPYFQLDDDDFTIIDNRPRNEELMQ